MLITIYEKSENGSFEDWLEKVQYNPALAITDAIRATSPKSIYNELELNSLTIFQWYRKMIFFSKAVIFLLKCTY